MSFPLKDKGIKYTKMPKTKEVWLKLIYKMAVIKAQSTAREDIERAMSQIRGTLASCDLFNPWRKEKKNFNYKKKSKK